MTLYCSEHLIFSGKNTPQNLLFYKTAPIGRFQIPVIFLERKKQKNLFISTEAFVRRCSVNKVVLKNSHGSQENTCPRVSLLIKLQAWSSGTSVFLRILWKFQVHHFYKRPPMDASIPPLCLIHLKSCNCIKINPFHYQGKELLQRMFQFF